MELAEKALENKEQIYSLGPLIHNPHVVNLLEERGIKVIDDLKSVPGETVLIRSHGASPEVFEQAAVSGITVIDATCPFVKRIQKQAADLVSEGYQVVIVGQEDHPEVKGILGWARGGAVVIQDIADLDRIELNKKKVGVLAQTTQNREHYFAVAKEMLGKSQEMRIFDTVCHASQARQEEAAEIAKHADVMVVIGGKNSANTKQLVEICQNFTKTYHIEDKKELTPEMLQGAVILGVTAGASTPDWIIEEVIESMTMFEEMEKTTEAQVDEPITTTSEEKPDEVVDEAPAASQGTAEPGQEEMMNLELETLREIKQGDLISGVVVQVRDDEVLLDIGGKSEGLFPAVNYP